MNLARGLLLTIGAGIALTLAAGFGIARAGPGVRITVEEPDGADVRVAVPGFVVGLALRLIPDAAIAEGLDEARPWLETARDAARALEEAGDVTLVRIVGPGERVTIATRDGVLVVDVVETRSGGNARVRVEMPLRTVECVVRRLERASCRAAARAERATEVEPAAASGASM